MKRWKALKFIYFALCIFFFPFNITAGTVTVGSGSYTTDWPAYTEYSFTRPQEWTVFPGGYLGPPLTIYKTANFTGPVPTNDWWSSVVWLKYSNKMYSIPLAYQCTSEGMDVTAQNYMVNGNTVGGYWSWVDFTVKGAGLTPADARLDAATDWSVDIKMVQSTKSVTARLVTGSPYTYFTFENCQPVITFNLTPVYSQRKDGTVITDQSITSGTFTGDTIRTYDSRGHYYGWFAPQGTVFQISGGNLSITLPAGSNWLVVGLMALGRPETWNTPPLGGFANLNALHDFFYQHAYAWPTNTTVSWNYDRVNSRVNAIYNVTTEPRQYSQASTLQGIYAHQYKNMQNTYSGVIYDTCRGKMRVLASNTFTLTLPFHGLLPYLPVPNGGSFDPQKLQQYVTDRYNQPVQGDTNVNLAHGDYLDTYWSGKYMASIANLIPIANIINDANAKSRFTSLVRNSLADWLTFNPELNENNDHCGKSFVYYEDWRGLFGFLPGYGTERFCDQHFHYGYFIYSAALLSLFDQNFAGQYGGMIDLLVRQIAAPTRNDTMFPFLRFVNPYHGHSWANGSADSPSGNDQESVSEALNAWAGIALWGMVTGNQTYENLGIFLHCLEYSAAREYWYDIDRDTYDHSIYKETYITTMVWGDHSSNATWFSPEPEHRHGIIYMPINPSSLYLGLNPAFVQNDYNGLLAECGGNIDQWTDIHLMYRSFCDAAGAAAAFNDTKDFVKGSTWAYTYMFVHNLNNMGKVDASVTADTSSYAVFNKSGVKSYMAFNPGSSSMTVHFSDGFNLTVPARSLASTAGLTGPSGNPSDTQAPTVPTNLAASATGSTSVQLSWTASTDNTGVTGYNIFRNGAFVKSVPGTSSADTGLTASTAYSYRVSAYDAAGNQSAQCAAVSVTTQAGTQPQGLPPVVFGDSFNGGGYAEYHFNTSQSAVIVNDTSSPNSGAYNIKFTAVSNAGNANARFDLYYGTGITSAGLDLTSYTGIELYMKASVACKIWIRLGDGGNDSGYKQAMVNVTTSYQKFTLDLGTMDAGNKTDIDTLLAVIIQTGDNGGAFNHTLYVDDIKLLGGSAGDTAAPTAPANLTATVAGSTQINLAWTASTDNVGVTGYKIYRNGTYLKSVSTTSASDTGLAAGSYAYKVSAYDAANNESAFSTEVTATITATDTQAPTAPANLTASVVSSSQINLTWTASTDNVGVTGYKIYRDNTFQRSVTGTSASDTGLQPGTAYAYAVSAYDAAGNESVKSNTASATTQVSAMPDMIVTDIQWTPASPKPGDAVAFNITVKNQGAGPTPNGVTVGVGVWVDGTWINWAATDTPIAAGASVTLSTTVSGMSWTATSGSHTIRALADDAYRFNESNENNNTMDKTLVILPDMIVTDIQWTPASPKPGEAVYFSITVKNQGTSATPSGVAVGVGVWIDGTWVTWTATNTPVAAGASVTLSTTVSGIAWAAVLGSHTVRAFVDDASRFAESNEANNTLDKTVVVSNTLIEQTPWKSNQNGTLYTNYPWNYTMGYHFTPQKSGKVTRLYGYFNGTKAVKLWNKTTGALLAQANVTSANSWSYVDITPVSVTSGTAYTVAVTLGGSGGSYRNGISALPKTYGDIRITGSTSVSGNARPTSNTTAVMYGQVDVGFVAD